MNIHGVLEFFLVKKCVLVIKDTERREILFALSFLSSFTLRLAPSVNLRKTIDAQK